MLATVVAIIGSFLAEVAGGVIAYQLTEGRKSASLHAPRQYTVPSQRVVIEHRHVIEYRSTRASSEDELWGIVVIILFVIAIIITIVGVLAALVAHYGSLIAQLAELASLGVAGLACILALIILWQEGKRVTWERLLVPLFIVVMCGAFFGMAWMLEKPLNPPTGWQDVREALRAIEIGSEGWTYEAFEIALDNFQVTLFFALQALGLLPQALAMILTLYLEGALASSLLDESTTEFYPSCLVIGGIPTLAVVASFSLGLGWPIVASVF